MDRIISAQDGYHIDPFFHSVLNGFSIMHVENNN